jgi:transcriptional regulator with XRE-family HTH domain
MRTSLLEDFGVRVRATRERRGWSQRDLGAATGMTQKQIYDVEAGVRDVRLSTLVRILDALEIPAGDLLDDLRHCPGRRLSGRPALRKATASDAAARRHGAAERTRLKRSMIVSVLSQTCCKLVTN